MQNNQTLPPRPFQEAQAESSKEKEKKSVSTKSNRKNNEKKTPKLAFRKSHEVRAWIPKQKEEISGLTESKTLPKTKER